MQKKIVYGAIPFKNWKENEKGNIENAHKTWMERPYMRIMWKKWNKIKDKAIFQ